MLTLSLLIAVSHSYYILCTFLSPLLFFINICTFLHLFFNLSFIFLLFVISLSHIYKLFQVQPSLDTCHNNTVSGWPPQDSNISGSNRRWWWNEFIARRRDSGLNLFSSFGAGMFIERDGSDDNEDADDQGGSDQGDNDQGEDDKEGQASNDKLLPDLEMPEAPIGELTKKKVRPGRRARMQVEGWGPGAQGHGYQCHQAQRDGGLKVCHGLIH